MSVRPSEKEEKKEKISYLQNNSLTLSFSKCDFSYSCAAVDKFLTDIARRAVPELWQDLRPAF